MVPGCRRVCRGVAILMPLLVAACGGPPASSPPSSPSGTLTVTGSSTLAPLTLEIAKRYEAEHPGTRVDVQTGGSSRGIADVRRGMAAIGMVSRALTADEDDLASRVVALDGISLIVHRDNPIQALTRQQVVDIYTGGITDWQEVGGHAAPITVVNKADGRATLDLFVSHFGLDPRRIRAHVIIGDNEHGIRTVAGDPNAIGYVSIGTADYEVSRGVPIRMLPMAGVEPTLANVRNGTFPLARPLNLVTHGPRPPLVEAFIRFAASPAVRDLVEDQFFVPISD